MTLTLGTANAASLLTEPLYAARREASWQQKIGPITLNRRKIEKDEGSAFGSTQYNGSGSFDDAVRAARIIASTAGPVAIISLAGKHVPLPTDSDVLSGTALTRAHKLTVTPLQSAVKAVVSADNVFDFRTSRDPVTVEIPARPK